MPHIHKRQVPGLLDRLKERFGTASEAARRLGVSRSQLYKYDASGIPTRRIIRWREDGFPLDWLPSEKRRKT